MPLIGIQRQLRHSSLGITSIYLQGIHNAEIVDTVHVPPRADDQGQHIARALMRTPVGALLVAQSASLARLATTAPRRP